MKERCTPLLIAVLLVVSMAAVHAGETDAEAVVCPVCGYVVNKDEASMYEHDGRTYYFCEPGCKAYFMQNTEQMTSGSTMDAVCGKVITKEDAISIIYENRQVDFCSEACKDAYLADPGKYDLDYDVVAGEVKRTREMKCRTVFEGRPYRFISEANKKKFEENPGAYVWAECPVGGEVFLRKDAAGKREYKGKTYYLGCKGCLALFDKDPEGALKAGKTAHNKACTHESGEKMQPACVKESKCPHAQKPGVCPHAKKSNTDADEAGQKECPHAKARQENREKKDRKRN